MEVQVASSLDSASPIFLDSQAPAWNLLERYSEILSAREEGRNIFRDENEAAMEPQFRDLSNAAMNSLQEVVSSLRGAQPNFMKAMNVLRVAQTEPSAGAFSRSRDHTVPVSGLPAGIAENPTSLGAAHRSESIYLLSQMCSLLEVSAKSTVTTEARKAEALDSLNRAARDSSDGQRTANRIIISLTAIAAASSVAFPILAMLQ